MSSCLLDLLLYSGFWLSSYEWRALGQEMEVR